MLPASYSLRPLAMADYDAVMDLWRNCEGVGTTESDTRESIGLFLARNPDLSLVAENGTQIVAAVMCGHDGRRGALYHLAVHPAHRRNGLASELVNRCLATLRQHGVLKCNILLFANNEAGRRFWNREGWSARKDLVLMQKPTA